MKLEELKAREIIISILGERGRLKSDDELSVMLKKRLTKKERFALNAKVTNVDIKNILEALNVDMDRYEAILAGAIKKIKNEKVHGKFYNFAL